MELLFDVLRRLHEGRRRQCNNISLKMNEQSNVEQWTPTFQRESCKLVTDHEWRERGTSNDASKCPPSYHGLNVSLPHLFYTPPVNDTI